MIQHTVCNIYCHNGIHAIETLSDFDGSDEECLERERESPDFRNHYEVLRVKRVTEIDGPTIQEWINNIKKSTLYGGHYNPRCRFPWLVFVREKGV